MGKEPTKEELKDIEENGIEDFGEEISTTEEEKYLRELCGVER